MDSDAVGDAERNEVVAVVADFLGEGAENHSVVTRALPSFEHVNLQTALDGIFMNFAYSWAFFNPVRKVYCNFAITGLPVGICFFIGTVELLGLLPTEIDGLRGFLGLGRRL